MIPSAIFKSDLAQFLVIGKSIRVTLNDWGESGCISHKDRDYRSKMPAIRI